MADSFIPDSFQADKPTAAAASAKPSPPKLTAPPTALDVILNPQGIPQHLISLAATAALTGGGGALAKQAATKAGLPELAVKLAPAMGRIATSGGLGAAEAIQRGQPGRAAQSAVMDGVIAGAAEGLMAVAGKPTKAAAKAIRENETAQKAFSWALEQPEKALQAISPRIDPYAMMNIPSLSRQPLHVTEIAEKLKTTRGVDYQEARDEIIAELTRLSGTGPAKTLAPAGTSFAARTSPQLFEPTPAARGTRQAVASSPITRSLVDAAMTQPSQGGWPVGAGVGMSLYDVLGHIPHYLLYRAALGH